MYRGKHIRHRRAWILSTWAAILLVVVLLLIPFIEPYRLDVDTVQLTSFDLAKGPQPLRVVFVSDFCTGGWPYLTQNRANGIIRQINNLNADLVLLGGDYAANPADTLAFFEQLPAIKAGHVYADLGEKDRSGEFSGKEQEAILKEKDPEGKLTQEQREQLLKSAKRQKDNERIKTLRDAMDAKDIQLLVNETVTVGYGDGGMVTIIGIDEPIQGEPNLIGVAKQVKTSDYVILLGHNPSVIEDATRASDADGRQNWFDLALFGHTHGNQFFGGFNPLGLAKDVVTSSHRKGWVREIHDTPILISRGTGTSVLPVRLGCVPQIHCIDVVSSK